MKKIITKLILLSAITAGLVVASQPVYATQILSGFCNGGAASSSTVCKDNQSTPTKNPIITLIGDVISVVSFIIGVAAIFVIIISGIRFVMSNGNSNTISQVRSSLLYAVIGLVVAALAESLVAFVLSKLN